jgi:agmatine deiminase
MDGYAMPAEWAPHRRCWMAWPCRLELWGQQFEAACRAFAEVARTISAFEPVTMLTPPALVPMATLQLARKVEILPAEIDDSWTRDNGPIFLKGPGDRIAGASWRFNGCGNRSHPHDRDARLATDLLERLDAGRYEAPMVLEGGAVHVDGQGSLLATESCLLNANRNPTLDRRQIEERLALYLGVRKIIWLPHGLVDDGTDGHVDNVARFVAPGRVMCAVASDPADPNAAPLRENLETIREARDGLGRMLEVIELPLPAPRNGAAGRLPLSYLSFYIANGAVVMPSFGDPIDEVAMARVADAFPDRRVVQVPALEIAAGGGGIHRITQQQPAGAG